MSIFDDSTIPDESPDATGQEETGAEEQQDLEGADNQQQADPESQEDAENSPSEEEQGEEEQEEYIPAKTYKELRGEFTRKAQEAAELRRRVEQLEGQRQTAPPDQSGQGQQSPRTWDEFNQQLTQYKKGLAEAGYDEVQIEGLAAAHAANFRMHLAEQKQAAEEERQAMEQTNKHIDALVQEYPDLKNEDAMIQLARKVQEIAADLGNPSLAERPTQKMLKLAAQELYGDGKAALYQKAKAKGKQEALDAVKAKQGVTTTVTKKQQDQPKTPEEEIADNIVNAGRRGGVFG